MLIALVGPTAIGKTSLAIQIARYLNTEIISADSRQFYIEMTIGTAKPSEDELLEVKHHFINNLHIHQDYTVGDYEKEAVKVITNLLQKHNTVILAGGSGLFVKAICEGFDELPKASTEVRADLNQLLTENGLEVLLDELKFHDSEYFAEVDKGNPQRIIRALEVIRTTNQPFSSFRRNQKKKRPFKILKIGLNTDRQTLYDLINLRVNNMIKNGLVEEVKSLELFRKLNPLKTIGYTEIFEYLDGTFTLDEAIQAIQQNTRRFAKRQLTWFRKDTDIKWFEPNQLPEILDLIHKTRLEQ